MIDKSYPAKILLFGEYSVIHQSKALAIPLKNFFGCWKKNPLQAHQLEQFLAYLKVLIESEKQFFPFEGLRPFIADLEQGQYFESSIGPGKGLGSSGAFCAAVYQKYFQRSDHSLLEMKKALSLLENFHHSRSSGIDPLVSLLQTPILCHGLEKIEVLSNDISFEDLYQQTGLRTWLVDSMQTRRTSPLVDLYHLQCENAEYLQQMLKSYCPLVDQLIGNLNGADSLWVEKLNQLCSQQYQFFAQMFRPLNLQQLQKRRENGDYFLKLCGAGGGGYYLVFEMTPDSLCQDFSPTQCIDLVSTLG